MVTKSWYSYSHENTLLQSQAKKKTALLSRTGTQYTKVKNCQNVFPIKQNNKVLYILNTNIYF